MSKYRATKWDGLKSDLYADFDWERFRYWWMMIFFIPPIATYNALFTFVWLVGLNKEQRTGGYAAVVTWYFILLHVIPFWAVGGDYWRMREYQGPWAIVVFVAIPIWVFVIPALFLTVRCAMKR